MKNSEFVSRIQNGLNALNKDSRIARRYIISIGRQKAESYIAQKWAEGTIFKEDDLFTTIRCFELSQIETIKCPFVEFRKCGILMKSKKKITDVPRGKYGAAIIMVSGIDSGIVFNQTSLREYSNNKKRTFGKVERFYYYINDGYLYIPDIYIEAVDITLISLDGYDADCSSGCDSNNGCKSFWDYGFICPEKIREYVIQETIQEIAGTKLSIPVDENPDLDSNQKSRKTV